MNQKPKKELDIAVGLIIRNGSILLLQRKDDLPMWDKKWEFPGGKIEKGESAHDAIRREIAEETGLTVTEASFLGVHHHDWILEDSVLSVHIHCFECSVGEGEVVHEEKSAYGSAWTSPEEALTFDSLEANADILKKFLIDA